MHFILICHILIIFYQIYWFFFQILFTWNEKSEWPYFWKFQIIFQSQVVLVWSAKGMGRRQGRSRCERGRPMCYGGGSGPRSGVRGRGMRRRPFGVARRDRPSGPRASHPTTTSSVFSLLIQDLVQPNLRATINDLKRDWIVVCPRAL